jgi:hypothetical protein
MAFNNDITPGAPPLRWDRVLEAFTKVNENFDILVATVGAGSGLTPIDFGTLDTNVAPATDNTYSLGVLGTNRWKSVFLAEYQDTLADQANGVYIGSAQIRGRASTIELPLNSTVVGVPIKEPFFNSIQVDNELRIEANAAAAPWGETVNLNSGTAMQLVVSSGADSITFNNTGVTSLAGTAGQIAVSTATGNITLTNLGVLSLTSTTALPSGRTEGAGININASTGSGIKVTNTGVLSVVAGSAALSVTTDVGTGVVTITNTAPAGNTFGSIIVAGDTSFPIVANSPGANFKVNGGEGITLTKDTTTDTLTITVDPVFDLRGSVFADDSTVMVDAVSGTLRGIFIGSVFTDNSTQIIDGNTATVYGNIQATTLRTEETKIALGENAGNIAQGAQAVAIGSDAGNGLQGGTAVAVGSSAGRISQGIAASALGFGAGETSQGDGAIAIGASTGATSQGILAVAIGNGAGQTSQGTNAIAIGPVAGQTSQPANTIILNATGLPVNGVAAQTSSFYVDPIRTTANGTPLMYNATTKEITYSNVLEFVGSTISTSDSSSITVDVLTTFNSDVTVDNELTVTGRGIIGGNLTAASFTGTATDATTGSTAASVGYMGIPQSATATTATLTIGDAGKHIYVTTNTQTITIPANASVAYPIGTAITFIAGPSATTMTIAIATDTMYLAGTGTTGSRTLAAHGMATAIKVSATAWYINGTGLT